ncbi:hypothetical protein MJO29_000281 [Puccinia striiformis f. sp. tritici]|nr:hypothetical protein MJO29_000281 [Puccinia striiformis f. sp. tritici]
MPREKTGAVFSAAVAPNRTLTPVDVVRLPEGPILLELMIENDECLISYAIKLKLISFGKG